MLALQTESETPQPFLPTEFENWAEEILADLNMVRDDITAPDIRDLYVHLSLQEPPSFIE